MRMMILCKYSFCGVLIATNQQTNSTPSVHVITNDACVKMLID